MAADAERFTYRVGWSADDDAFVARCVELPAAVWRSTRSVDALAGAQQLAAEAVADLDAEGGSVPAPLGERRYSGRFNLRVPPGLHRDLTLAAAEQGISLNRLIADRLGSYRQAGPSDDDPASA